jgi:hypothetical protein
MTVIDTMSERGQPVMSHDVLVTAIEALVGSGATGEEAEKLQSALEHLIKHADLPCMEERLLLRLLNAYANQGDWNMFWETWRIPPRFCMPRSPQMYAYLYQRMANTRHQSRCIDALRWCVQEMINEEPPVQPRGAVLQALKNCIRVADPQAEALAQNLVIKDRETERLANREFVKLIRNLEMYQR